MDEKTESIVINGARENNLKNLSLSIPKNKIVVITGPSGSGKSSLAFDTIHAEAQWRFIESLSLSSKFFINKLPRPKVDSILGLSPSIALKQGIVSAAGRSVGSFTEIIHLLASIYTRQAHACCPKCETLLKASTAQSIVNELSQIAVDRKLEILAPVVIEDISQLAKLRESGIVRLKIENQDYRLDDNIEQIPCGFGYIVFDRLKTGNTSRLYDSVESAIKLGAGKVVILVDENRYLHFQEFARCEDCNIDIPEIKTQIFTEGSLEQAKLFKIDSISFYDFLTAPISEFNKILASIKISENSISILNQIKNRIELLTELDLGHLQLDRDLASLSSGEIQRLRLVLLFAAELSGVIYILDEPSAHLDLSAISKVLAIITKLKAKGNSLLIVDHHPQIIKAAEYLIEMGPAAGEQGGSVIAAGQLSEVLNNKDTLTNKYFSNKRKLSEVIELVSEKMEFTLPNILGKQVLTIPSSCIVAVCGNSAIGKSSLLLNGIVPAVSELSESFSYKGPKFNRVLNLESSYSVKTLRSNPASMLEVFSSIRELFAGVADSKIRGFSASRFSFNVKGGRCEDCQGAGVKKLDLTVLSDVYSKCETCEGQRYNRDTLAVKFKGLNINQVLELSIAQAANIFKQIPNIYSRLMLACEVGVSYLSLGQAASSISGGEYQRLKVAQALNSNTTSLFVLDEPCLGLYASDVEALVKLLNRITSKGNSVVVATQNLDLIVAANYVVSLGAKKIDFSGTHQQFINSQQSRDLGVNSSFMI